MIWHWYACYNQADIVDYYASGMSEYASMNTADFIRMKSDMKDEIMECWHELREWNTKDAFYELLDVWHCFIKYLLLCTPAVKNKKMWKIVAWIAVPFYCIKKHGIRYKETGCIRSANHHTNDADHKCRYLNH